jgi:acylphosphatase
MAATEAERLGVKGWVCNTRDGDVEVWAEGPEEKTQVFLDWLHQGPRHAHVREVRVTQVPPNGYKHFSIDHDHW